MKRYSSFPLHFLIFILCTSSSIIKLDAQQVKFRKINEDALADGSDFNFWEKREKYTKTYYVDQGHTSASDDNTGTEDNPFLTISRAAELLMPGERVIIKEGVYREKICPARGGKDAGNMITYMAAKGHKVIVSGSEELDSEKWEKGKGWIYGKHEAYLDSDLVVEPIIWQYTLEGLEFNGYNPFGMLNMLHDREYLQYQKVNMKPHFKRRGMIFIDGEPLEQVLKPVDLVEKENGAFWVEHNGMRIHVRFPSNSDPGDYKVEVTTKEQLFVPKRYGIGYVRVKGIHFQHGGNGFPVPQRGIVSSNRGHHWIIEDCIIEWANALGIDLGNEMWHTVKQGNIGYHVVKRNIIRHCGIGGLEALRAPGILVEDNLFENIGWQDAELAFESGGIKFHMAKNCLIRRNVFRNIKYAPGIWLDFLSNQNCRIVKNVFTDITTARGAIYIEVSRNDCLVDHNIFHKLRSQYWISGDYGAGGSALYTDGSDSIRFEHNLIIDIENSGYGDYLNAKRIVGMRGGVTRWHKVTSNVFIDCRKHAIEFPNEYNYSDFNVFSQVNPGYLKMANPEPSLLLDIEAWRKLYGWEKNGIVKNITAKIISDELELSLKIIEDIPKKNISAGPFNELKSVERINIDPRILK